MRSLSTILHIVEADPWSVGLAEGNGEFLFKASKMRDSGPISPLSQEGLFVANSFYRLLSLFHGPIKG